MTDLFPAPDFDYVLVVKAGTDQAARSAFEDNRQGPGRVARVSPLTPTDERLLTASFDFGDGSEWGGDPERFRSRVERGLNEWMARDLGDCLDGAPYPPGSLLWWRPGDASQEGGEE